MNKLILLGLSVTSLFGMQSANAQWVPTTYINTPICQAQNTQIEPNIIEDGTGGVYTVWKDFRNNNIADAFLQRLNKEGVQQWIIDGLNVCTNPQDQSTPTLCSDGHNGVIAAWSDFKNGTDRNIYAQRVDSSGVIQWTYNGIEVTGKPIREYNEKIISDGDGGAIIVWEQGSNNNYDIWAQRIDANGTVIWPAGGIRVCPVASNKLNPRMVVGADKMVYIIWQDQRAINTDIWAQKVDMNGNILWGNAGKAVAIIPDRQEEANIALANDGLGIYIAWADRRLGNNNFDIYAQYLDSTGAQQWLPSTGAVVCNDVNNQIQVAITSTGISNGFVSTWRDYRTGGTSDIYMQKLDTNGAPVFAANGLAVTTLAGDQLSPVITNDSKGGVIIAYQDRFGGNSNIKTQKYDAIGVAQWAAGNVIVTNAVGDQQNPKIIPSGEDGIICVWEDARDTANRNIFGQKILNFGAFQTTAIGTVNNLNVSIWPNPTTGFVTIQAASTAGMEVFVTDVLGKNIPFTMVKTNQQINIQLHSSVANGLYLLQCKQGNQMHTIKLMKQ
jgi:hypothetical protein